MGKTRHNVEFKAELRDPSAARQQCHQLGGERIGTLKQTDTYYRMTDGRLKKREAPGEPTEWIYYHRRDIVRPRMSSYAILSDAQAKRRWGTHSLRAWLKVAKKRELWMLENIRIHLDDVLGLGRFIEFEAVISKEHDTRQCHEMIGHLREVFGPTMGEPVGASYCDLMAAQVLAEEEEQNGQD
ncbi:MAG: class IV adenylate cyclase [Planctomycetota bacterium]